MPLVLGILLGVSHLRLGSQLQVIMATTFIIDLKNWPCDLSVESIATAHPSHGKARYKSARGCCGAVAWVRHASALTRRHCGWLLRPGQPICAVLKMPAPQRIRFQSDTEQVFSPQQGGHMSELQVSKP